VNKRTQGIFVSVYIPADMVEVWKSIENKSKFVQEAISKSVVKEEATRVNL